LTGAGVRSASFNGWKKLHSRETTVAGFSPEAATLVPTADRVWSVRA
jgi:hypothetical protein